MKLDVDFLILYLSFFEGDSMIGFHFEMGVGVHDTDTDQTPDRFRSKRLSDLCIFPKSSKCYLRWTHDASSKGIRRRVHDC